MLGIRQNRHAVRPGVHVHRRPAQEPDEGEADILGELDRERRRRRDRGEDRDAGHRRLLHKLEAGPPRDLQHRTAQRETALLQRPADDLVDRVMASDVFPQHEQLAGPCIEQACGVQTAGLVEGVLMGAQRVRKRHEGGGIHGRRVSGDVVRRHGAHRLDRRLAAHAARAGRVEAAVAPRCRHARSETDIEDVVRVVDPAGTGAAAVDRRAQVVAAGDDALTDEEARRELHIMAGSAHRHGERLARDPDLEGLLDGQRVGTPTSVRSDRHACDRPAHRDPAHGSRVRARG